MICDEFDRLATSFIDGECTEAERMAAIAHLRTCRVCRTRAEAESAAKRVLQARATPYRSAGAAPPWRPRVLRLGRPLLPAGSMLALLLGVAGAGLGGWWLRPAPVLAVGIVSDSFCAHQHRFSARFNVDDRECTLGCVRRGAQFVLVTDTQVYRIRNQQLPQLATFANRRVNVEGTVEGDQIDVASLALTEVSVEEAGGAP
jgi:hypothetical protein